MLDKPHEGYEERLKDGKVLLFIRGTTFYARVYKGERTRSYLTRSLKTKDLAEARKLAERMFYEIEIKRDENLPLQTKRFKEVITEYLRLRRSQHERGTYKHGNKAHQQQTSAANLRQMERVSKFWVEYCGSMGVDKIDNAVLSDYVAFSLYSLRHTYAVTMLKRGKVGVFEIAKNMGTSVEIIERYYGRSATAPVFATRLG